MIARGVDGQATSGAPEESWRPSAAALGLGAALGAALLAAPRKVEPLGQLDEPTRIAHLLRRAGFGASPAELAEFRVLGLAKTVDRLIDDGSAPDDVEEKLRLFSFDPTRLVDIQREWVVRMVWSSRPLVEKMTLFWHGLLTSANAKVGRPPLMRAQNAFFREHAFGDYGTILKGISKDPAMMLWLDTHNSRRAHPNENYARELLELFSMGVGHYGEEDVREAARAFTGWTVNREGEPVFDRRQFDPGPKSFLGATVTTPEELIDAVVAHPATGRFVAGKLFGFFAYPGADADTLEPFADVFRRTGGSIRAVVRAILTSDVFYSPRAYRARLKSPVEYAVGALRALGVPTDGRGVVERLTRMGQQLYNPPNVAGWPGGRAWLNSGTWIERLNFANGVTALRGAGPLASFDLPRHLEEHGLRRADEVVEHFLGLLVDGRTTAAARRVLHDYLGVPPETDLTADRRLLGERVRGLVYLVMAMPEYQLC
jgi:hypothetical protein